MPVIARRFTILTLMMTIFAIGFAALVAHPARSQRVHVGTNAPCYHPASQNCTVSL